MGTILKMLLGFIPGVGPLLSGGLGIVTGLFTKPAASGGGVNWTVILALLGSLVAGVVGWKAWGFYDAALADHAAVATLTAQVSTATAAANQNAAALRAAEAQHAAVIASATAATAAASARADTLNRKLEALRHAPRSVCTPSATARSMLDGLRK